MPFNYIKNSADAFHSDGLVTGQYDHLQLPFQHEVPTTDIRGYQRAEDGITCNGAEFMPIFVVANSTLESFDLNFKYALNTSLLYQVFGSITQPFLLTIDFDLDVGYKNYHVLKNASPSSFVSSNAAARNWVMLFSRYIYTRDSRLVYQATWELATAVASDLASFYIDFHWLMDSNSIGPNSYCFFRGALHVRLFSSNYIIVGSASALIPPSPSNDEHQADEDRESVTSTACEFEVL